MFSDQVAMMCQARKSLSHKDLQELRVLGIEPRTYGLKGRCSTPELHPLNPFIRYGWLSRYWAACYRVGCNSVKYRMQ